MSALHENANQVDFEKAVCYFAVSMSFHFPNS